MIRAALALACLSVAACSSSGTEVGGTDAAIVPDPFADAGASGAYGDRASACARVTAAMNAKAAELGCSLSPAPECPAYVDRIEAAAALTGRCIEYDLGTVATCEKRVAAYTQCSDFSARPCSLSVRESKSGTNCADAGADAPTEGG